MPQIQQLGPMNTPMSRLAESLGQLGGAYAGGKLNQYQQKQHEEQQQKRQQAQMQQYTSALQQALQGAGDDPRSQLQAILTSQVPDELKKLAAQSIIGQHEAQSKRMIAERPVAPKAPPGGPTAQPIPPEIATEVENIIKQNPTASADELAIMMGKKQIPQIYSNQYVESRRRQDEQKAEDLRREETEKGKRFIEDRAFHARIAQPSIERNEAFKRTVGDQERNLETIENAAPEITTKDYLADLTGFEPLRSEKASEFSSAVKDFFITDVSAITGQKNKWIEQQIKSALPGIGKSPESNIAIAKMWRTKLDIAKEKSKNFDKLRQQDMENFGFEKNDIEARAEEMTRPYAIQRDKQLSYDLRVQYEKEDPSRIESLDNVPKGTPLTLEKARYLVEKFEDKAEEVAKKLGYDIPSPELYQRYVE